MALDLSSPTFLDDVYQALFAQLQTAKFPSGISLQTSIRATIPPDSFPPDAQPALVLVQGSTGASQKMVRGVTKWQLKAFAVVYFRAEGTTPLDQDVKAQTTLNYLIWGLVQTLATPQGQLQTLGDSVYHCWVEGEIDGNIVEQQCIIGIPILIEV